MFLFYQDVGDVLIADFGLMKNSATCLHRDHNFLQLSLYFVAISFVILCDPCLTSTDLLFLILTHGVSPSTVNLDLPLDCLWMIASYSRVSYFRP